MNVLLQKNKVITLLFMLILALTACTGINDMPAQSDSTTTDSSENQTEPTAETSAESDNMVTDSAADEPVAETTTKFNLNTVTADELMNTIPDFSSRMVREFHEYRPYISIQEFRREIGKYDIADAQIAIYEEYVYVPININESDAETLKQLPGVDDGIAESLMDARPFESDAAFLETLGASVSAEDAKAAEAYLEVE